MQNVRPRFLLVFFMQFLLLFSPVFALTDDEDRSEALKKRYPNKHIPIITANLDNDLRDLSDEFQWATDQNSALYFGNALRGFLAVHPSDYDQVPKEQYTIIIFGAVIERLRARFKTKLNPVFVPPPGEKTSPWAPAASAISQSVQIGFTAVGSALAKRMITQPAPSLLESLIPSLFPRATFKQILSGAAGEAVSGPLAPVLVMYTVYSAYSDYKAILNEQKEKWFRDAEREISASLGNLKQLCEQEIRKSYLSKEK